MEVELLVRYFIMPNIINEVKLDFKDVLLRPKRSTLRSRADVSFYHDLNTCSALLLPINNPYSTHYVLSLQVDLYREITFRNSKRTYKGIPVIASNMDTVGTFEMAKALAKVSMFCQLTKARNRSVKIMREVRPCCRYEDCMIMLCSNVEERRCEGSPPTTDFAETKSSPVSL